MEDKVTGRGIQSGGWKWGHGVRLGPEAKAVSMVLNIPLGLWDKLTERLVLSVGPEDGIMG